METIARLGLELDSSQLVTSAAAATGALGRVGQQGGVLERAMLNLSGVFKQVMGVLAAVKITTMGQEILQLGARYETLGVVLNTVGRGAGFTSTQMEGFEKALQKTGISMIQARQNLARMVQAKLDLAQASDLARVAQNAATIADLNSSEAFERIVSGIQSGNTMILRNMGIIVDNEKAYQKLADTLGKNVGNLTEQEKTQGRMNAVMAAGTLITGSYEAAMDTAGKQIKSTVRYLEDAKVKVGLAFQPQYRDAVFAYAKALKWLGENADKVVFVINGLIQATKVYAAVLLGRWLQATIAQVVAHNVALKATQAQKLANLETTRLLAAYEVQAATMSVASSKAALAATIAAAGSKEAQAVATRAVVVAETQLTLAMAASTVATRAATVATGALAVAMAGAATAARTMWLAIGGWAGLAVIAVLAVYEAFKKWKNDGLEPARESAARAVDDMNNFKDALVSLSSAQLQAQIDATSKLVQELAMQVAIGPGIGGLGPTEKQIGLLAQFNTLTQQLVFLNSAKVAAQQREDDAKEQETARAKKAIEIKGLELERAKALNAAFGQSELDLRLLEIRYDTKIKNHELAHQYQGKELATLQGLNKAMGEQAAIAAKLEEKNKKYIKDLQEVYELNQKIKALMESMPLFGMLSKDPATRGASFAEYDRLNPSGTSRAGNRGRNEQASTGKLQEKLFAQDVADAKIVEQLAKRLAEQAEATKQIVANVIRDLQSAFAGLFEGMFRDGALAFDRLWDTMRKMLEKTIAQILAGKIMQRLSGAITNVFAGAGEKQLTAGALMKKASAEMLLAAQIMAKVPTKASDARTPEQIARDKTIEKWTNRAAAGVAGFGVGYGIGSATKDKTLGALGGAAGGAAAGAAFGPWGAAIGGLTGFVGGLLGANKASQELAKQFKEMQKSFAESMAAFQSAARGFVTLDEQIAQVIRDADKLREGALAVFLNDKQSSYGEKNRRYHTEMEKIAAAQAVYVARLKEEQAFKLKMMNVDLDMRLLLAAGMEAEVEAMRWVITNENELTEARRAGADDAMLAKLATVQVAEANRRAADAAKKAAEAVKELAEKMEALRIANRDLMGDASARVLSAMGRTRDAEDARQFFGARKEMEDAIKAGMSPSTLAMLAFAQTVERWQVLMMREIEDATNAIADASRAEQASFDRQIAGIEAASKLIQSAMDAQLEVLEAQLNISRDQLRAAEQAVDDTRRVIETLREFSSGLKLNQGLSTLSPIQQLAEARSQYEKLLGQAQGGDKNAAGALPEAARALLDASKKVNASGPGYVKDFKYVQHTINAIADKFKDQLSVEEQILKQLQSQTTLLETQILELRKAKEQEIANAAAQIAALQLAKEQAALNADKLLAETIKQITETYDAKVKATSYWQEIFVPQMLADRQLATEYYTAALALMKRTADEAKDGWEQIIKPIGELPPLISNPKYDPVLPVIFNRVVEKFEAFATEQTATVGLLQVGFRELTAAVEKVSADVGENTTTTRQGFEGQRLQR